MSIPAKTFHTLITTTLLASAAFVAAQPAAAPRLNQNTIDISPEEIELLLNLRYFREKYIDPDYAQDFNAIAKEALKGAFSKDPNSEIFTRDELIDQIGTRTGIFHGIGITTRPHEKGLYIARIRPDTPASRSTLKPGDIITHIDGKNLVEETTPDEASKLLRGDKDTTVRLLVERNGFAMPPVDIIRAEIKTAQVTGHVLYNGIAHIKIPLFVKDETAKAFKQAVESVTSGPVRPKALLIDLRGNIGGSLKDAVEIADMLIDDTGPIVHEIGRTPETSRTYKATPGQITDLPIGVLVDGGSASASELVTAALQDHKRAIVFGEGKTFGKGTVQEFIPNQTRRWSARITVAQFFSPLYYAIQWHGITPDVLVTPLTPRTANEQYLTERDRKNSIKGGDARIASPAPRVSGELCTAATPGLAGMQTHQDLRDPLTQKPDMDLICAAEYFNPSANTALTRRTPYTPPPTVTQKPNRKHLWKSPDTTPE